MRIAINTLAMKQQLYGVGNYVKNLTHALASLGEGDEYLLLISKAARGHVADLNGSTRCAMAPVNRPLRLAWEQFAVPRLLKNKDVDVLHGATFALPLRKVCPEVVTIHDMTFLTMPERHSFAKRIYFGRMIPHACRSAEAIIAISESAKQDIIRVLGTPADKVHVIYHGVNACYSPVSDGQFLDLVRRRYRLPPKFILNVGLIEPRKNLLRLVEAYESARDLHDYSLVLAGSLGWGYEPLLSHIGKSAMKSRIHLPGYIADTDLPALYTLASVFVYPSLYEGFGLPTLEAMACGTPVVTSNVSSLPEVVGNAGVLIDPCSVRELTESLRRVLGQAEFASELRQRGRERAQSFTWERTARKTLKVYRAVANT